MNQRPRGRVAESEAADDRVDGTARPLGHDQRQTLVAGFEPESPDEVQLAPDLVTYGVRRFVDLRNPIRQQMIGIFSTVGGPARYFGEVTKVCRRQRILREDGEDNRRIEATAPEPPGPSVLGFVACGAVVRRSAFLGCGGFDDRLGFGGEERLLAVDLAAAGWGRCYVHEIVAHHCPAERSDRKMRARLVARNRLWCVWLRQPVSSAVQATLRELVRGMRDRPTRAGMVSAVAGIPWVLSERNVVSDELDAAINLIYT